MLSATALELVSCPPSILQANHMPTCINCSLCGKIKIPGSILYAEVRRHLLALEGNGLGTTLALLCRGKGPMRSAR